jgi:ATPase subunit of ABC transporter with duplicated ATPase domains
MANNNEDTAGGCCGLLILAAIVWCCGGYIGWWTLPSWMPWSQRQTPETAAVAKIPSTPRDTQAVTDDNVYRWKQKVVDWKEKQQKTQTLVEKLQADKEGLVTDLRTAGVNAAADLKDHPTARVKAQELQEVVKQIAMVQKKYDERTTAIEEMESHIRRAERVLAIREVGVSDEELAELSRTITDLDERLTKLSGEKEVAPDLKLEAVLDQELKGSGR